MCYLTRRKDKSINITIMSYKIHKIQGLVVAELPGKIPKTLNASKI